MRRIVALDPRSLTPGPPHRSSRTDAMAQPTRDRAEARLTIGGVVGAAVVTLVVLHLRWPDGMFGELTYVIATVGAGVAAVRAAAQRPSAGRRTAVLMAAGVAASAVADVLFFAVAQATGAEPEASLGDPFWIASYVFLIGAVLDRPTQRSLLASFDADELIDFVSSSVVVMLVMLRFVDFGELFADTSVPAWIRTLWATYPVLDALLLAALLRAVVAGRHRGRSGVLLSLGVACWLASDLGYMFGSSGDASRWHDVGWMLGAWGLALAVRSNGDVSRALAIDDASIVSRGRIAMTLAPLLVPPLLDFWAHVRNAEARPFELTAGSALLIGCALIRSVRLVRVRDEQRTQLAAQERYYRAVSDHSSDAIALVDDVGRLLRPAPRLAAIIGGAHPVTNLLDALPGPADAQVHAMLEQLAASPGQRADVEILLDAPGRSGTWLHLRGIDLGADPAVGGIVISVSDVSARKIAELELNHLAFHDALTKLANRSLFEDRLENALRRCDHMDQSVAVLFLDVDGFKAVNDHHGHATGDAVLADLARRLVDACRDDDTVARLGGDEFAIVVERPGDALPEAIATAERVLVALRAPSGSGPRDIALSASVGIAVSSPGAGTDALLRDADVAMYRSKALGKSRWTVYDSELSAATAALRALEDDIASAPLRGELRLEFQPVVSLATSTIVGMEALVRWQHPERGLIGPSTFVPIAENNGAIHEVGRWVIETACTTAATWTAERHVDIAIGINLSAHQLADPAIVDTILQAATRSGIEPAQLVLEVTETALVQDPDTAAARLRRLRDHGIRLAIDDFGVGYSSLSYLRQFPFDILKIDRSFIAAITDDDPEPAILLGLLEFGRTLGLEIVAEGIETEAQLDVLRRHGCQFGQGYLFTRPVGAEAALHLVARELGAVGAPS